MSVLVWGGARWGSRQVPIDRKGKQQMIENYFMRCRVYAWGAWGLTATLIGAAWIVAIVAPHVWWVSVMLGVTGLAMSAVAATLHIRSFMVRVCSLVRAASYKPVDGEGLRPVG